MACMIEELRGTTIARWYTAALNGPDTGGGCQEPSTGAGPARTRYYRAFLSKLKEADDPVSLISETGRDHELRDAVLRAANARSASTLYSLAGPRAPGSMLAQARDDVAARSQRGIIGRLCAEVKVWRHWPYRVGWLTQLGEADPHSRQLAAGSLIRVLAVWAHDDQQLAATYDCDPPLSAVEDFLVVVGGGASSTQVRELLRRVVETARGPLGSSPLDVFEAMSGELAKFGLAGRPTFGELTDRLAESLAGLRQMWPHLDSAERTRLHQEFGSEFVNLAAIVGSGHGS